MGLLAQKGGQGRTKYVLLHPGGASNTLPCLIVPLQATGRLHYTELTFSPYQLLGELTTSPLTSGSHRRSFHNKQGIKTMHKEPPLSPGQLCRSLACYPPLQLSPKTIIGLVGTMEFIEFNDMEELKRLIRVGTPGYFPE